MVRVNNNVSRSFSTISIQLVKNAFGLGLHLLARWFVCGGLAWAAYGKREIMTLRRTAILIAATVVGIYGWVMRSKSESEPSILCQWLNDPSCENINWIQALAGIGVVFAAIVGLIALWQKTNQARASFMLQLDDHWEEIRESRTLLDTELNKVKKSLPKDVNDLEDKFRILEIKKRCLKHIKKLRKDRYDDFRVMLQYLDFFESMGLMVRRGYIPISDMISLLRGSLDQVDLMFGGFIPEWQKEMGLKDGLYEHAWFLIRWSQRFDHWWGRLLWIIRL